MAMSELNSLNLTLNVSDIQYFSVGDGDGIRTTLFLKGCNLRCPWCHNPETISAEPQTLNYKGGKTAVHGKKMTPEELFPQLIRDKEFFAASGGGVTVSGGEPLLQSKALVPLLGMLKEADVHVIIDTAASLAWNHFEDVIDLCDCFFVDYKSPRTEVYRDTVGGSRETVEENISRLVSAGKEFHIRVPLIPGVNDSDEDAIESCKRLSALGAKKVDILPFHRLGSGKYDAMGLKYAFEDTALLSKEAVKRTADIYRRYFTVTVEK